MIQLQTARSLLLILFFFCPTLAQSGGSELSSYNEPPSRLRGVIEKYREDYGSLFRFYTAQTSTNRAERIKRLNGDHLTLLEKLDFDSLNHDEQVDYILFRNYLEHEQKELARNQAQLAEMATLIPFAKTISDLEDQRRRLESIDPAKIARLLTDLNKQILDTQKTFADDKAQKPKRTVANRAAKTVTDLKNTLRNWYNFHSNYDPMFTWWNEQPYKAVDGTLEEYARLSAKSWLASNRMTARRSSATRSAGKR